MPKKARVKKVNLQAFKDSDDESDKEIDSDDDEQYLKAVKAASELTAKPPIQKPEDKPHWPSKGQIKPEVEFQADFIQMPVDGDYSMILSVVDVGSRQIAAKPLKNKEASHVRDAMLKIFQELGTPKQIDVDDGSEFKGSFKQQMDELEIFVRVAQPNRQLPVRMQAVIDADGDRINY